MRQMFRAGFAAISLVLAPALLAQTAPASAAKTAAAAPQTALAPAPLSELAASVALKHDSFTLPNGLRVVVHTDRKAPVVAVSVWYHVGSKDEPLGKTGFAHLFEHLMYYGSENHDALFFEPLESIGATDANGSTWFDRTNYYETVPTSALDLALFLESDRMGHLLGAVTQAKLDAQRSVVQNEKRQGDNAPYGLADYAILEGLFPAGHPYRHDTIGSMADLNAASVADVHAWFKANYGPNNAVLVLSGDIDVATAKPLVAKYFGDIPSGPTPARFEAPVPRPTGIKRETMYDAVGNARINRAFAVPGRADAVTPLLDVAATIIAGGSSSRAYNELVRRDQLAVGVSGGVQAFEKVSLLEFQIDVKPGADPATVAARFDAVLNEFLKTGPTADEVQRVATRAVAGTVRSLEAASGQAATLAEGELYTGDPDFYRTELARYADATPEAVAVAARSWLSGGSFELTVLPGKRTDRDQAADKVAPKLASAAIPAKPPVGALSPPIDRSALPKVGATPALAFPAVERASLRNGIKVTLARRPELPVVKVMLAFDAGISADDRAKPGTQSLMLGLLDEGTTRRTGPAIGEEEERLGANISAAAAIDRTRLTLDALTPNLAASLDLFADIARNPKFDDAELARVRGQALAGIKAEMTSPQSLALRELPPIIYGTGHPYGVPFTGTGTTAGVTAVTRADLQAFHARWLRPDNAALFVVGDTTLAQIVPLLETTFGDWQPDAAAARGTKSFTNVMAPAAARIVLIDRPGSPQSLILGGKVLGVKGRDDNGTAAFALVAANDLLGGLSTSRLNLNIREAKGWAYGVQSLASLVQQQLPFLLFAPVQTDRTGDALAAIAADMAAFGTTRPIDSAERNKVVENGVRSLPGEFENAGSVLTSIERNAVFGRPDDYQATLAARYQALTTAELNRAALQLTDGAMVWIVVGDRKLVEPQLAKLKLPVEVRTAP